MALCSKERNRKKVSRSYDTLKRFIDRSQNNKNICGIDEERPKLRQHISPNGEQHSTYDLT